MRLVTWNVNSLKMRLPRVLELLDEHAPDVVCFDRILALDPRLPESLDGSGGTAYKAVPLPRARCTAF